MSSEENSEKITGFFLNGSSDIGILLLHGWSAPPEEMRLMAEYLNSLGYTISAPLLRGHGTKPEDLKGVIWQEWFEDSQKALEELKKCTSKIFVGGISMGGDLAMLISEDKDVVGIIALGAPVKFNFQSLARAGLFLVGLVKSFRKKYYPPWVRKKMQDRKEYKYYPVDSAKTVIELGGIMRKFLPKITKPILIMQSTSDHLVSRKSPQIIFDEIESREKEIFWVEDGWHVFVEKKEVWEKIEEFVSQIVSKSGS